MIELSGLKKSYQMGPHSSLEILKGFDLRIEDGEFVAIMGPSGSGKSTLMNIIGLLDVPTSGSYKFNSVETSKMNEDELAVLRRQEIGFIFQQFNLLSRMSAAENVALPLLYSKRGQGFDRANQLLSDVGLSDRTDHRPNELSGGQQQRVAIARALVTDPTLIVADEPTGDLDRQTGEEILVLLDELHRDLGKTIVMVTHDPKAAARASRQVELEKGVLVDAPSKPVVVGP